VIVGVVAAGQVMPVAFDANFDKVNTTGSIFDSACSLLGQAPGNFDQAPAGPGNEHAELQLAVLMQCGDWTRFRIATFSLDSFTDETYASFSVSYAVSNTATSAALATGDFQGRSLLLGPPQVLRFQYASTNLIIGSPPMHVDHVTPVGSSDAVHLNLSAMAGQAGYSAGMVTSETETVQTAQKSTTSYNATGAIQGTASLQLGGVFWGFDASVTAVAEANYDAQVSSAYNTYGEIQSTATAITGFGDLLDYNLFRVNIYAYPVIGQSACLADDRECASSDEVPLYMIYSGTDQQSRTSSSGAPLEWYQPPQQPGNIFSCPASLTLLSSGRQRTDPYFALDSSSLRDRASKAGGDAQEPVLPDQKPLLELEALAGKALLAELCSQRDTLIQNIKDWTGIGEQIANRWPVRTPFGGPGGPR
jgi:hypothetical protein